MVQHLKTDPKILVEADLLEALEEQIESQHLVIVHCKYLSKQEDLIRIWPSTFLFAHGSDHKSHLIHAENIMYFPFWQRIPAGSLHHFSLIFSPLPKSCERFDLIEITDGPGNFHVEKIERNQSDIYSISI